jgi:hypothetical protein
VSASWFRFCWSLFLVLNKSDPGLVFSPFGALAMAEVAGAAAVGEDFLAGFVSLHAGSLELELAAFFCLICSGYHGGGRGDKEKRAATFWSEVDPVRSRSLSTEALELDRRRLPFAPVVEGRSPWSYVAHRCSGSRRAVSGDWSLSFLVEGRPRDAVHGASNSSRLICQMGGSSALTWCSFVLSPVTYRWRCSGELFDPSGLVPGIDRLDPGQGLRTGSQSFSEFWGPLCKKQGLVCNFPFCLGPCVNGLVLLLFLSNKA